MLCLTWQQLCFYGVLNDCFDKCWLKSLEKDIDILLFNKMKALLVSVFTRIACLPNLQIPRPRLPIKCCDSLHWKNGPLPTCGIRLSWKNRAIIVDVFNHNIDSYYLRSIIQGDICAWNWVILSCLHWLIVCIRYGKHHRSSAGWLNLDCLENICRSFKKVVTIISLKFMMMY